MKSLAKSLGFEIIEEIEKPYNPEFVKEIFEATEEVRQGKGIKVTM